MSQFPCLPPQGLLYENCKRKEREKREKRKRARAPEEKQRGERKGSDRKVSRICKLDQEHRDDHMPDFCGQQLPSGKPVTSTREKLTGSSPANNAGNQEETARKRRRDAGFRPCYDTWRKLVHGRNIRQIFIK